MSPYHGQGVSEYIVRQSRSLVEQKRILSLPDPRKGRKCSAETIQLITDFYIDDGFTHIMPGQMDKVSVKKNVYQQMRLVLCNLHELYVQCKWKYPYMTIRFSKFASLQPTQCVLAGAAGTHFVCVCAQYTRMLNYFLLQLKLKNRIMNLSKNWYVVQVTVIACCEHAVNVQRTQL